MERPGALRRIKGRLVRGCLMLAVQADGCKVETIEGLSDSKEMSELRRVFHEHNSLQCGFCTPGMLMAARDLQLKNPAATREQIRAHLSGNYCRCAGRGDERDQRRAGPPRRPRDGDAVHARTDTEGTRQDRLTNSIALS